MRPGPGRIVTLVIALLLLIALLPKACAQVMLSSRHSIPLLSADYSTLTNNLISYWRLDESSTGSGAVTRVDSEPTGTPQNLTEPASFVQSQPGLITNAVLNNGQFNWELSHADSADLSVGDIDFTFSLWVKLLVNTNRQGFISKWNAAGNSREYLIEYNNSSNRFIFSVSALGSSLSGSVGATNFGAAVTNVWYNIIAWHDSTNNQLGISINGTSDTSSYSSGVFAGTSAFYLGYSPDTGLFVNSLIDEVGFWKRILTPTERAALYNAGTGKRFPFN